MADQDPWAEAAKSMKASTNAGTTAAPTKLASADDPWADAAKNIPPDTTQATQPASNRTWLSKFLVPDDAQEQGYEDLTKGLGETLAQNVASIDKGVSKIPVIGNWLTTPLAGNKTSQKAVGDMQELARPVNDTQAVGKTIGDVGESLAVPEAEGLPLLGRVGVSALGQGVVGGLQSGTLKGAALGAGMGAGGTLLGAGLKAVAPHVAESALNIRKLDRAYGKTPGEALLTETSGFTPGTVAESARNRLDELTPQLMEKARAADARPVQPVRGLLQSPQYEIPLTGGRFRGGTPGGLFDAEINPNPMLSTEEAGGIPGSPLEVGTPLGGPGTERYSFGMPNPQFLSGTEHPELSGRLFEPTGVLRTRDESLARTLGVPFEPSATPVPYAGASLTNARNVIGSAAQKATAQNEPTAFGQLQPMLGHLSENRITGEAIPDTISAEDLLNLKRGFGNEFIHHWNPDTMEGVKSTAANTYGALDKEFDRVVPGAADLNQRISSLIPVAKRAESAELNAPTAQRAFHRLAAHTGAATLGGLGAVEGGREHGLGGALTGGALGVLAPELLASPTAEMMLARSLYRAPAAAKLVRAGVLGSINGFGSDQ